MGTVTLTDLTKTFPGGAQAVEGVSLEVGEGELMVLVGPSGSGKSTILRLIAGLEEPTRGEVWIGGRRVNEVPPGDRDIAMVFQNYALYPHMTAFENMAFGLRMRRVRKDEVRRRVESAAGLLGIGPLLGRLPRDLSGGERQRVALGRALVRQPAVFLFDEPLSNLDAQLRVQMRREILLLHQRLGTTMIYVTHDQVEAMTMGHRIAVMKDGRLRQVGAPLEVYDRPADTFVAAFIGTPQMNLFEGTLREEGGVRTFVGRGIRIPLGAASSRLPASGEGAPVILGIRPERCVLLPPGAPAGPRGARGEGSSEGGFPGPAEKVGTPSAGMVALEGFVEAVEPLGGEVLVHLRAGDELLVARSEGRTLPRSGERRAVRLDMDARHLFDAATGRRLSPWGGMG